MSRLAEEFSRERARRAAPAADDGRRQVPSHTTTTTIIQAIRPLSQVRPEPEPDWLWHGYVAPGAITVLSAKPKVGKSTLLFGLLAAWRNGAPFAGRLTRQARVLYVSEEGAATMGGKMHRFRLADAEHVHWVSVKQIPGATWEHWCSAAAEVSDDYDVVVFDTYPRLAGFEGEDEKGSSPHLERIALLDALTGRDVAVVLVCHERKAEGSQVDRLRGGNALAGAVDILASLEVVSEADGTRVLHGTGRFDSTPERYHVRLEDDMYVSTDAPEPSSRRIASDHLAGVPADERWRTAGECAQIMGLGEKQAKRHLDDAVTRDEWQRRGAGTKSEPFRYRRDGSWSSSSYVSRTADDHHLEPDLAECIRKQHPVGPHPDGKPRRVCFLCHPPAGASDETTEDAT